MIVDMMRCAGYLGETGMPGMALNQVLLVGHSLGGACCIANSAVIRGVAGTAVMAPTACLHPFWQGSPVFVLHVMSTLSGRHPHATRSLNVVGVADLPSKPCLSKLMELWCDLILSSRCAPAYVVAYLLTCTID